MECLCANCGAEVGGRTDDCYTHQASRFDPRTVVLEDCGTLPEPLDPYERAADWDVAAGPDPGPFRAPLTRSRPELLVTRWRSRGIKDELYRDDPPT